MAGYDASKATTFNKLRQQGLSEDAALAQAGISDAEINNYAVGTNGQMGALVIGTGTKPGVEVVQRVDYDETADAPPSSKTLTTYTTTSTETVSGGGSTTITAGPRIPTAQSQAYATEAAVKQSEISQFTKDNPSNFIRKRQGLPPLTPEENEARSAQLNTLQDQRSQIYNQQIDAETSSAPTITTVPNTTTTTQTITTGTSSINSAVNPDQDAKLSQNNEEYLQTTTTVANANSARKSVFDPRQDVGENVFNPGATYNGPATQESVFDPRQDVGENVFDPNAALPNPAVTAAAQLTDPYAGLSPTQLQKLGGADPTDPYIRARLGIPQLPGSELNPAGFATPLATGVPLIDNAAAAISKFSASLSSFFGSPTKPAVTTQGTTTGTPPPAVVDTKAVAKDATAAKEQNPTLDAAAKENLTNIQEAGVNTAKAEEYIDINNRNIQANEQSQSQALEQQRQAQAIIDQNNAELADDNLPDDRRAQLEANNAAQYASIAENAAVIDEAQNNIDQATANNEQQVNSILENQYVAVENADAYRINTTGSIDENGDPVNDTANDPGFNDYGAPEYNAATDGPLTDTGTQELTEEETAALFNEAEAAVEPPPLAAPGEPGGPPLLTDAEIATLYGVTDTGEIGAITGTVITTDAARVALSDPEAIRAQEALNREVLENPATLPDVTVTELTDAEAAGLFEEAEAELLVEAAGDVDPDEDPELLAGPEEQEPFTDLAEPVDPDADPELLAGPEEQEPFTELAEPVDPDEDPELLAGPEEQEPFTDLAEPVDPDEDPELLGGPEEQEPFTDLAEPVDPDADPELLAGPEEEIDPFAPLQEPPDVDATEDPELLGGPTEEDTGPELLSGPEDVDPNEDPFEAARQQREEDNNAAAPTDADVSNSEEAVTKAKLKEAQNQATAQQRINQTTKGDWRVRLRLAPGSQYLYNSNDPGILKPLRTTDGVIFPYMPTIQTGYTANYDKYELTHSNFRGYYYKNSQVADVNITGTFTAQDTAEAEYMLAVIHFFRSATKMFYGQDPQRGAPPPLVYLSGLGEYQFNDHTCVISSFTYNLPNDVDYIAVTPNNQGINLSDRQTLTSSSPPSTLSAAINRLKNAGLSKGAKPVGPIDLGVVNQTVSGTGQTTYVPTKMDITITLLPINTRKQVSQEFSLNRYANGDLLKKGFW